MDMKNNAAHISRRSFVKLNIRGITGLAFLRAAYGPGRAKQLPSRLTHTPARFYRKVKL